MSNLLKVALAIKSVLIAASIGYLIGFGAGQCAERETLRHRWWMVRTKNGWYTGPGIWHQRQGDNAWLFEETGHP